MWNFDRITHVHTHTHTGYEKRLKYSLFYRVLLQKRPIVLRIRETNACTHAFETYRVFEEIYVSFADIQGSIDRLTHVYTHAHLHDTHIHTFTHSHTHTHICMYVYIHTHTYRCMYTCIHTHVQV